VGDVVGGPAPRADGNRQLQLPIRPDPGRAYRAVPYDAPGVGGPAGGPAPVVVRALQPVVTQGDLDLLNMTRAQKEENKGGIFVAELGEVILNHFLNAENGDLVHEENGEVFIPVAASAKPLRFTVRNSRAGENVAVRTLVKPPYILGGSPELAVRFTGTTLPSGQIAINPGDMKTFTLQITPSQPGKIKDVVVFQFGDFVICRYVSLHVQDPQMMKETSKIPSQPAYTPKVIVQRPRLPIVPGVPPLKPNFAVLHEFSPYHIPQSLYADVESNKFDDEDDSLLISLETHSSTFSKLVHIEEIQMEKDIRNYDMVGVELQLVRRGESGPIILKVPGLAEKRPNISYGSKVYVRLPIANLLEEYEGIVHRVDKEEVVLRFGPRFYQYWVPTNKVEVRFKFSRIPLRRMHRAMELCVLAQLPPTFIFPTEAPIRRGALMMLNLANARNLNEEQLLAVKNVVQHTNGRVPYLIFGPPGTGKTKTLIEAIMQVHLHDRNTRILAMAPSNAAADLLVERLSAIFTENHMHRLNSYKRPTTDVPEKILKYSTVARDGYFAMPSLLTIKSFRCVVTTCVTAGLIHAMGVPKDHFTHFFVDEAGQATEPELLIGLAGLASAKSQVVLTGDPKQL
ncbi:hypothetical protein BDK51DRAFT_32659, partial [Blyttiomyces helicus]